MLGLNPWNPAKQLKQPMRVPTPLTAYQQREIRRLEYQFARAVDENDVDPSTCTTEIQSVESQPYKGLGVQMHDLVRNQVIASLTPDERARYEEEQRRLLELAMQLGRPVCDEIAYAIPSPDKSMVERVHTKTRQIGENISRTLNLDPRYPYRF
jgi:hypothetical protein